MARSKLYGYAKALRDLSQGHVLGLFSEEELLNGVHCPTCSEFLKIYPRKLNSGMANTLTWLVGRFAQVNRWIDIPEEAPRSVLKSREEGKLLHWGLVETRQADTKKHSSGLWRPTEHGIAFVHRRCRVPSHAYLYKNRLIRFSKTLTTIDEAGGKDFDREELLKGRPR